MSLTRTLVAAAAVAGLGLAGFASATADAAPVRPRPAAKPKAAGDWIVYIASGDIQPARLTPVKGAQYTMTDQIEAYGNQATGSWKVTFNTAPGGGAVKCSATATNGGVVNGGTITWTNVKLNTPDPNAPFKASYKITCTYQRDFQPAINEKLTLTAPGHVLQENETLGDTQVGNYTIGGTLPSGTPTPKPPVKDKDSNGGLSKTGV